MITICITEDYDDNTTTSYNEECTSEEECTYENENSGNCTIADRNTTTAACPCDDAEDSCSTGNATCCNAVCPSENCNCTNCRGDCNCDDKADSDNGNLLASAGGCDTEYLYISNEQVAMTSSASSVQLFPNAEGYRYAFAQGNSEICELTSDGHIQFYESGYIMVDVYNSEGEFVGRYGVSAYLKESGTNTLVVGRVCCCDEEADTPVALEPTSIALELIPDRTTLFLGEESVILAMVYPVGANQSISFSSSNASVATVDTYTGVITPIASGTTTITATTANGKISAKRLITVDSRERVYIEKDGDYFNVHFSSGLTWKSIGCDLSLEENRSGYTMWLPEDYENLFEHEKRYLFNYDKKYTVQQLAYLYFLDPLGVEYFIRHYDMQVPEILFFKDQLYKEIFGEMPHLIKVFPDKTSSIYPYPSSISAEFRADVYSDAEILFGEHPIYDIVSTISFVMEVIPPVLQFLFGLFIPQVTYISAGIELCKFLFFSSAASDFIPGAASSTFEEYAGNLADTSTEEVIAMFEWTNQLLAGLSMLGTAAAGIESFVPPIGDITIYHKVNMQNFQTNFVIDDSELSMQDIIALCELPAE